MTHILRSSGAARRAFTLIELIVVTAIIAILAVLLLAGVQQVRESANRASCLNNLKQLGLALHTYHDVHNNLPAAGVSAPVPHGWVVRLLPYLEQEALQRKYDWSKAWYDPVNADVVGTVLPLLRCPSSPSGGMVLGVTASVPWTAASGDYTVLRTVDADLADLGLADAVGNLSGAMVLKNPTRILAIRDGTSNTLVAVEDAGRPQRWEMGYAVAGQTSGGAAWASSGNSGVFMGYDIELKQPLGACAVNCTNDRAIYGFHTGGANAMFADGSVRFLGQNADIRVVAALVTRDGGEAVLAPGN